MAKLSDWIGSVRINDKKVSTVVNKMKKSKKDTDKSMMYVSGAIERNKLYPSKRMTETGRPIHTVRL